MTTEKKKWFPVQGLSHVPHGVRFRISWEIAEKAYEYYSEKFGKGQSLERLAERGGFDISEIICFLAKQFPNEEAIQRTDFFNRFPEEK